MSKTLFVTSMDNNPPGSPVHGIFQARVLEWVAISFLAGRGGFSWSRHRTHVSCTACIFFTTKPPGKPYRERCLVLFCFESAQRKLWQCKYETGLSSALFLHCILFLQALSPITVVSNRIHMQSSHSFLLLAQTSSFSTHPLHCQAA